MKTITERERVFFVEFVDLLQERDLSFFLENVIIRLDKMDNKNGHLQQQDRVIKRVYNLCIDLEDYPENYLPDKVVS